MEARVKTELAGREPADVEELYLDNTAASELAGLTDQLTKLANLSLVNCGLTSLKGLPKLPSLIKLDLSENKLVDGLDLIAANCPELIHLNISSNKFSSIAQLEPLKNSKIIEIDAFGTEMATQENYREQLFKLVASLQIVDGLDVNGEEVEEEFSDEESIGEHDSSNDGLEDEEGDLDEETEGPGLSYLNNSQIDEDEGEDYEPEKEGEEAEKRGKKRQAEQTAAGDEPEKKKNQG